eukprot:g6584.t1
MSSERFKTTVQTTSAYPNPSQLDLREGTEEEPGSSGNEEYKGGWSLVKEKLLVAVGASLNFRTLRDMYGDVVLDPKGNFGTVSKYQYIETDGSEDFLAIKRLRPGDISAQVLLDFMREVKILKKLKHFNIAAFRGTGYLPSEIPDEEDDVFLAQELMEGGTLRAKLEKQRRLRDERLYSMSTGLQWLLDVANALAYLHGAEPLVIHRDLKLENIMLNSDNIAKIVDFGLHKVVDKWEREDARDEDGFYEMTGGTGAYIYMAPEAFMGQRYNHKVDVYSFAVVAWEVVHYQMLIVKYCTTGSAVEVKNYAKYVATESWRPKIATSIPSPLADLISEMWQQDPNDRPEFEDIIPRLRQILEDVKEQEESTPQSPPQTSAQQPEERQNKGKSIWWCCFC